MKTAILSVKLLLATVPGVSGDPGADREWRQWRGPNGNSTASATAGPPLTWGEEKNVRWKSAIPGRGLSSPVVVGGLVLVTTATDAGQLVIAYARDDGSEKWRHLAHAEGIPTEMHRKNSAATSTVASDGGRVYAAFPNGDGVWLTALDLEGNRLWRRETGKYRCDYKFGYAPSPTIHGDRIIVSAESLEHGYLAAFALDDGAELWRTDRKHKTSYSSPIVAGVAGRDQILLSGADKVCGYDPADGRLLWEIAGTCAATCGTAVWSDDTVFASGGFPGKETLAVRIGEKGSPEVLWRNGDRNYEQSLLYHAGHLYAFNDNGIATCWVAETGEERWKTRLGGPVSASPVLAGGRIYAMNERGITHVFEPNPDGFVKLAENTLGEEGFATPVFVGREVFLRTATLSGERQEWLYCLGEE